MHKFAARLAFGQRIEMRLDQVFHRLHVVVGAALEFLYLGGIFHTQSGGQLVQQRQHAGWRTGQLDNAGLLGQRLEPQCFHPNSLPDQAILAEQWSQLAGLSSVPTIDRRNGG